MLSEQTWLKSFKEGGEEGGMVGQDFTLLKSWAISNGKTSNGGPTPADQKNPKKLLVGPRAQDIFLDGFAE